MKKILCLLVSVCFVLNANAQSPGWVDMMQDPNANFYQTQQAFEAYWNEHAVEKGKGFKQFKRWEAFMEPRVFPTGELPDPMALYTAKQYAKKTFTSANGDWQPIGPFNGNQINGIGRVNRLVFHPTNSQIIYACTAAGGLWKTTDGGNNWTTETDLLTNIGSSDLLIDPTNTNIMYLATGDRDGGDTYSFGVLKSTDGGLSWNPTALTFKQSQSVRVSDLYMHPNNSSVIIASSRSGIYRTTNAGGTWQLVQNGSFNEVVQKPGNPNVLFTSTINGAAQIYRSVNNGVSWSRITNAGLPTSGVRRIEIGVTPDDSNYVYALMGASNSGFYGLYRSIDGGDNWTQRSNSPNLMGWSTTGNDNGGQAWYDLAIAVDPTNKNRIYTGGVNIWTSGNGGASWSLEAHWYGGGGAPFVHADIHDLEYAPNGQLWSGNDGGIYSKNTSGSSWSEHNDGLNITQYYNIDISAKDTTTIIAGAQDNGTHLLTNDTFWDRVRGGDGMDCAISNTNSNTMYSSVYYGDFRKSTNGGNSFNSNFNLPPAGNGNWVTPLSLDPLHPDTIYTGFDRVWRSYNGGISFAAVSPSNLFGGNLDILAVAPVQTNIVYAARGSSLWKSEDYGSNWVTLSGNVPGGQAITYVSVGHENENHVVISRSGYSNSQKVYESFDGGLTWENISGNLPNIPANCVVIEKGGAEGVYVGTDAGVYYRDKNQENWIAFNSGLPNVIVNELKINYTNNKLVAGTYGRGVWQSDLYGEDQMPVADFDAPVGSCLAQTVMLTDRSSYHASSWNWTIVPNTGFSFVNGTNAASQNPELSFTQAGIYNVSLTVSNDNGSDSIQKISALQVGGIFLPFSEDFEKTEALDLWETPYTSSNKTFRNRTVAGNGGVVAPYVNFRNSNNIGEEVELISPTLNFSDHDSVWVDFEYAYTAFTNNAGDSLKVYVSSGCSNTWTLVAAYGEDGTNNFVTKGPQASLFTPVASSNWCGNPGYGACKSVDVSAFSGQEGVRIKFVAVNGGGNAMYIDNINVSGRASAAPTSAFSAPQTICAQRPLQFTNQSTGSPTTYSWEFAGGTPGTSNLRNPQVSYTASGTYAVKLKVSNALGADSVLKTNYITVDAASFVSATLSTNNTSRRCVGDTFTVTAAAQNEGANPVYEWFLNGTQVATTSSAQYSFTGLSNGDAIYTKLISSEACAFPIEAISDTLVADYYTPPSLAFSSSDKTCANESAFALVASPTGGSFSGNGVTNGMFDPTVAGPGNHVVTYTYTDTNGCTSTKEQTVTVNAPAIINFTMQDYCDGDDLILLNTGFPAGGTYSGTGVTANYLFLDSITPGVHQITYSFATQGCAPSSKTVTYNILASPTEPVVTQQGDTLLATNVSAGATLQWYDGGTPKSGATGSFYIPTSNGNYRVVASNSNSCTATSNSVALNSVGLAERIQLLGFEMYPNPAKEVLHINFDLATAQEVSIELNNLAGQQLRAYTIGQTNQVNHTLSIDDIPAGIYMLRLVLDEGVVTKKFSKI